MKKSIFGIILLFCVNSYAINGFSIYKMYSQYDTVTHTNLDSNLNRPASWSSLLVDTLDRRFIRFTDLTSGDSTLSSIKIDTIKSNPYMDSITGNVRIAGSPTITGTLTVDTLKSTKGINATGGTFSSRVTAADVELSDSMKAPYGLFSTSVSSAKVVSSDTMRCKDLNVTDLTSGYVPYKSTNLENSNIFTNGTNTAVGKSSLESWGTAQRALQIGGNTAIVGSYNESSDFGIWHLTNSYYDGAWKPQVNGIASRIIHGGAYGFAFAYDTGLVADVGFTPTTRFSWTLSGGLNVTNKIVTSDSIIAVSGKFSGRITASDIQLVDSVKSVSGAYSGRVTATDIELSDSVKAVSGEFSGAITSTTLNTGNGANELYPMNQAVTTTSDVSFDSSRTRVSVFDSVKLGTGSYLKNYLDTTFTVNVYEDNTLMTTAQIKVVQIGKMIMMYVPTITITKVGVSSDFKLVGIPSKFIPSVSMYCHVIAISNSDYMTGYAEVGNPFILGATNDANVLVKLAPGTSGVAQSIITWIIN